MTEALFSNEALTIGGGASGVLGAVGWVAKRFGSRLVHVVKTQEVMADIMRREVRRNLALQDKIDLLFRTDLDPEGRAQEASKIDAKLHRFLAKDPEFPDE